MPDIIRHPETLENTGFRLSPERRIFLKTVVYGQTLIKFPLPTPVLDPEPTPGVFPFNGIRDAGNHTSATFETARKFNNHLPFLVKRIKVRRTGIDTETFFTVLADLLVQRDMGFFVVFKGIEGQLFSNLHQRSYIFLNCIQSFNVSRFKKSFFSSCQIVL